MNTDKSISKIAGFITVYLVAVCNQDLVIVYLNQFQPWAAELEREMQPAMKRVEEQLGSALDDMGFSFGNERIDSHLMDTTGEYSLVW